MHASVRQEGLFDFGPQVLVEDGEGGVFYLPGVIAADVAARWFTALRDNVDWNAMRRPMYDRIVDVPRLVSSYRLESELLPEPLTAIAERVRTELGQPFNTVGLNYYRDARDSVAPHNDKLETLVAGHPIALLSLGATRRMTIRAKVPPRAAIQIDLEPGSLLVMSHASQLHYDHGIPKSRAAVEPRISRATHRRARAQRGSGVAAGASLSCAPRVQAPAPGCAIKIRDGWGRALIVTAHAEATGRHEPSLQCVLAIGLAT